MKLRAETSNDYNQIAKVNYIAFSNGPYKRLHIHESELPSLARQRNMFDRELSIVAEMENMIVGHILLTPSDFIVLGEELRGVILGPVCVLPRFQGKGVGTKLIIRGHRLAKQKGYDFSLLCGHPEYYPKFGYIQHMFSTNGVKIGSAGNYVVPENFSVRAPLYEDIEVIKKWQDNMRNGDTLALVFNDDLMDYNTNSPEIDSLIICSDNRAIGYVKRHKYVKKTIKLLFCAEVYLKPILIYLMSSISNDESLYISQPIEHFTSILGDPEFYVVDVRNTADAFMICPLNKETSITDYCDKLEHKLVKAGVIVYPPYVDID